MMQPETMIVSAPDLKRVLFMRIEILRAVLSKIKIFWDIMLCQIVNSC